MVLARSAFWSAVLLIAAAAPATAQGAWATVIPLGGSAGDVVGKLADGVKKAVDNGYAIGDEVHFHSLKASAFKLEYSIAEMTTSQTSMIGRFNHYMENGDHSSEAWTRAK